MANEKMKIFNIPPKPGALMEASLTGGTKRMIERLIQHAQNSITFIDISTPSLGIPRLRWYFAQFGQ